MVKESKANTSALQQPPTPSNGKPRRLDGLGLPGSGEDWFRFKAAAAPGMPFRLSDEFLAAEGRNKKPAFGFNGLGELVYKRTYSRYLSEDGHDREEW